ncbi:NADase-type glycan-binding domain-containing protein [Nocardioides sp. LHG3406-4]|uniref:NADase-type glycan-binding domain-containing protein n=1 Tax=Nocardioides sp. LHG3406-4 TaxID=2804575 RepID=UPI003CF9D8D8
MSEGVVATAQFERVPLVVPDAGPRPHREVPRWLPWLLGWLLLAVIAAMVGWAVGSDGSPAKGSAGSSAGPASDAPASPGSAPLPAGASDITATATAAAPETAPPNQDLDGKTVTYDAVHMLDGDPSTAWRMPGDGTGVVLTFTLPGPTRIASVGLVNGYAKVDGPVDWYPRNRRITSVTWGFDDGSTLDQELIDSPAMQTIGTEGVVTSTVTLTLDTVSAPGARAGRDYTPVSDVRLGGSSA